ncbi:unnamed protein product [Moneuplotes crassus]|uniref:Uncharacterized protein n=1 Tax=Euplotes crassus TaxID=5936 RepID=A0AAD1Y401_EUPCR|nr:unnamed protein product [Moneuplotes crassus]
MGLFNFKISSICLIVFCLVCIFVCTGRAATPFSIVNASDSSYTDACKDAGTLCEFCCMTDKVLCTMDLAVCDPISNRDLWQVWWTMIVLSVVVIAFPMLCFIVYYALSKGWCCNRIE